jgi:coenzyme F420-reducing hydrogenase alpha subunit
MIDVNKTIEIFKSTQHEYIGTVLDVGHSFIISSVDEDGEYLDTASTAINNHTGETSAYFPPDHWDELDNAKEIDYTEIKHSKRNKL